MKQAMTILVLAVLSTGCPTITATPYKPHELTASGTYVHAPSQFSFPESFGEFRRVQIVQYDAPGNDVGVGYNRDDSDGLIALTLYVKPRPRNRDGSVAPLTKQFGIERENILSHHAGADAGDAWTPPPTRNGEPDPGMALTFHYIDEFAHFRQEVESRLYLFEFEGWLVKYRITYLLGQRYGAATLAQEFVSSFLWREASELSSSPIGSAERLAVDRRTDRIRREPARFGTSDCTLEPQGKP